VRYVTARVLIGTVTVLLTACAGQSSQSSPPSPAASTAAVAACTLKTSSNNLIRWELDAGQKPYAQLIGDVNLALCKHAWDAITVASGPGYCAQVAWQKDNPGYNPDAVPAKQLKHVLGSAGAAC
jgi:hypothetical protein